MKLTCFKNINCSRFSFTNALRIIQLKTVQKISVNKLYEALGAFYILEVVLRTIRVCNNLLQLSPCKRLYTIVAHNDEAASSCTENKKTQ